MEKNESNGIFEPFVKIVWYASCAISAETGRQIKRYFEKKIREKKIDENLHHDGNLYDELKDYLNPDSEKYRERVDFGSDAEKSYISNVLGQALQAGNIEHSFHGLLACNIDLQKLAKSKDGFYRGFCFNEEGKFSAQAKFMDVDNVAAATPMIAFQAASFITGQYYQHVITQQLKEIGAKVSYIATFLEADDRNEILSDYNQICRLMLLKSFEDSDFTIAKMALQRMDKYRGKYHDLIENINIDVKYNPLKNENEIDKWCNELKRSGFFDKMKSAYWAEVLYYLYNMVLVEQYKNKYGLDNEQTMLYMGNCNPSFYEKYSKKYHEIKYIVINNIQMLSDNASLHQEECRKKQEAVVNDFSRIENLYSKGQALLKPTVLYEIENGEVINRYLQVNPV